MYHPLGVIVPPMNETMIGANQAADFYRMGAQIGLADLKLDTKKVTRGANDCLLSLGMGSSTRARTAPRTSPSSASSGTTG